MSREAVLDRLLETFRSLGYDGASLAVLSEATGLGKSSLYHYFPGGKQEMGAAVLARLDAVLEAALLAPLRAPGPPEARLDAMLEVVRSFYDDGRKACLLERMCASVDRGQFAPSLASAFGSWIDALGQLGRDAGLPADEARDRAEDAVARVEGALVVAAGTGEPEALGRALRRIRAELLRR
jgi:AcrR family transcriptional regulator